jgi:hypothetical protein
MKKRKREIKEEDEIKKKIKSEIEENNQISGIKKFIFTSKNSYKL